MLALVQVPEHSYSVLPTRGGQRAIGRYSDGVNVPGVTKMVGLDLAFRELPDLSIMWSATMLEQR